MKQVCCLFLALCFLAIPHIVYAQEDDSFDVDSMFDSAEDVEVSKEEELKNQPVIEPAAQDLTQIIKLYGSFSSSLGLIGKIYPDEALMPFASFENYLGFTARPASDISIKGQVYTRFPDFQITIDQLYFDYMLKDFMYVTAGATATSWGNSLLFDTNILDDESTDVTVLFKNEHEATKRFDAIFTIPVGRGQIQAMGMYKSSDIDDLDSKYMSYAGAIEYPLGPLAIKLFGRKWASADPKAMQPAFGMEITTDLFGNHINLWGKVHTSRGNFEDVSYAKFVGGISHLWTPENMGKIGFVAEYQFIYDSRSTESKKDAKRTNDLAFTFVWRHIANSDFSTAVQWYISLDEKSGYFIPSVSCNTFSHVTMTFIAPVIYGGASYTYKTTFTSTKDLPTILLGVIFTLSLDY